jgi:hypothetical protein
MLQANLKKPKCTPAREAETGQETPGQCGKRGFAEPETTLKERLFSIPFGPCSHDLKSLFRLRLLGLLLRASEQSEQ